jgi:hypothetical protein
VPAELIKKAKEISAVVYTDSGSRKVGSLALNPQVVATGLDRSAEDKKTAFSSLKTNVFDVIQKNIKISTAEPQYNPKANGNYDVKVDVRWRVDSAAMVRELEKYFVIQDKSLPNGKLSINKYDNERENQKAPFTAELYRELVSYQAGLKISIGSFSQNITLATGRNCFVSCEGKGDTNYFMQFSNMSAPSSLLISSYEGEQNPVVLKNVPENLLGQPVKVDFYWKKG